MCNKWKVWYGGEGCKTYLFEIYSKSDHLSPPSTIFTCIIAINFSQISVSTLAPYSLFFTQWTAWAFKKHIVSRYFLMSSLLMASYFTCNKSQAFLYGLPSPVLSGACRALANLVLTTFFLFTIFQPHWPRWSLNRWNLFLPQGLYTFSSFCLFCSFPRYLHGSLLIIQVSAQSHVYR